MLGLLEKIIISSSSQKKANKHFFKEGRVYYYFFLFFSSVPIAFAYNKHIWTMILKINSFKNCMVVTILKNLSTSGHRRLVNFNYTVMYLCHIWWHLFLLCHDHDDVNLDKQSKDFVSLKILVHVHVCTNCLLSSLKLAMKHIHISKIFCCLTCIR